MTPDEARTYAKEWLNRGRSLHYEIRQLTEYREKLLKELGGGVSSYTPREIQTDSVGAQAKADSLRLAYSETCDKVERRIAELAKINNTTLDYIAELPDNLFPGASGKEQERHNQPEYETFPMHLNPK